MVQRREKNWGLKAAACGAIVIWQIYDMASASVFLPNEGNYLRYLVIGAALFGLVASLVKLTADY
ncbi:MAG: hypothetical protein ABSA66_12655 [Roseiarcus sp.]|jgi:hypothetical protein